MSFEEFWKVYPRKVNKKLARKIWQRQKLDEKTEIIIKSVLEYAKQWDEIRYIPHPSTFLNGERWEDEFENESSAKILFLREVKK